MDKNSVIGFILIAILVVGFMWYSGKQQQEAQVYNKHIQDSTNRKNAEDSLFRIQHAPKLADTSKAGHPANGASSIATSFMGTEQLTVVENNLFKATFTNKGARLKSVELKNYKTTGTSQDVVLSGGEDGNMGYGINVDGTTKPTYNLYFGAGKVDSAADGTKTVSFTLADSTGQSITHQYIVKPNNYLIDWNVDLNGADKLLSQGAFNFEWQAHPVQHEKSTSYERQQSNVCFYEGESFDYMSKPNKHSFEKSVKWIGVVQQFFNTTLIAKDINFSAGEFEWKGRTDTSKVLGDANIKLQGKVALANEAKIQMQLYYGPTDYTILSKQPVEDMAKMVNLGRDLYSFVRPINRFIIMPVFGFFSGIVSNFGWAILLLTLFIRLVTSPLTYTSYLSGAKMKVLRPELDKIKEKTGDNQQAFAMEQMKLFREAGVNPLGGCIPALLQIPIFFALFSFFNSNINLRGVHFLWSHDLSSFDDFFKFKSDIPIIGDHVGLFTLTAIITSFLISLYNMNNTPTQAGPNAAAMKYMPYIFPFVLFFVFNKLPSALTWYYTVSNIITLALQFVIQTYIINHDKILAQIEVKRKAPKTQSKFQERYAQVVETQKKVQELKNKNQGKK